MKPGRGEPEESAKDVTPAKKPPQEKKKATLKPRVKCSQCDFVGVDGKEMDVHRKEHENTFDCTTLIENQSKVLSPQSIAPLIIRILDCMFLLKEKLACARADIQPS